MKRNDVLIPGKSIDIVSQSFSVNMFDQEASPQQLPEGKKVTITNVDRLFLLRNLLTPEECQNLISQYTQQEEFESIEKEYPPSYRNSKRILKKNEHELAAMLWDRIKKHVKSCKNVKPMGLDADGMWRPVGVNECMRFSRYDAGNYFKPHTDGQFVRNEDERSIFTILIYLNDEFEGGETRFLRRVEKEQTQHKKLSRSSKLQLKKRKTHGNADPSSENVEVQHYQCLYNLQPKKGMAAIFNHDLYHEGCPVQSGTKVILRTEIMFQRCDPFNVIRDYKFEQSEIFTKIDNLLNESDKLEKQGRTKEATTMYLMAQDTLAQAGHTQSYLINRFQLTPFDNAEVGIENELTQLPDESLINVFMFLTAEDICRSVITLNKFFYSIGRTPYLWKEIYGRRWPRDLTFQLIQQQVLQNEMEEDWFHSFVMRRFFEKEFSAVCVDLGFELTRFGAAKEETVSHCQTLIRRPPLRAHYTFRGFGDCSLTDKEIPRNRFNIFERDDLTLIRTKKPFGGFIMLIYRALKCCLQRHPLVLICPGFWANDTMKEVETRLLSLRIPAFKLIPRHQAIANQYLQSTCMVIDLSMVGISVACQTEQTSNNITTIFNMFDDKEAMATSYLEEYAFKPFDNLLHKSSQSELFVTGQSVVMEMISHLLMSQTDECKKLLTSNIILTGDMIEYEPVRSTFIEYLRSNLVNVNIVTADPFDAIKGAKSLANHPNFRSQCIYSNEQVVSKYPSESYFKDNFF